MWKEPGLTIGPLNEPCPENIPVPLIVPNVVSSSEVDVAKLPEPMNVAWESSLVNSLTPSDVNFPEPFAIPSKK